MLCSGMCDAITDHLCLWAQAATSCTKTCKGHAVVNSLLTPASEAVLSVPVGKQSYPTIQQWLEAKGWRPMAKGWWPGGQRVDGYSTYSTYSKEPGESGCSVACLVRYSTYSTYSKEPGESGCSVTVRVRLGACRACPA